MRNKYTDGYDDKEQVYILSGIYLKNYTYTTQVKAKSKSQAKHIFLAGKCDLTFAAISDKFTPPVVEVARKVI